MQPPVVIIAAGVASRLKPYSEEVPKCLMELEPGKTILDFILSRIEEFNPSRILIVTRSKFRKMFEEAVGSRVEIIETDAENFGNLFSVSLALKRLNAEGFLLLMSDHIYEKSIIEEILSSNREIAFTVCLDRKPSLTDAEEGLKIILKDKGVAYADKNILPRHGIDTGVIFCGKNAKKYVEKAIEELGLNATIADALKLAASNDEVDYVDVTGKLWKDIDTPEDLVKGRKIYWQILRRENEYEGGLFSRFIIKPLSTRISTSIYQSLDIEPLALNSVSLIFALLTSLLLAKGYSWGGFLALLVILLSEVGNELINLNNRNMWRIHVGFLIDRFSDIAILSGFSISLLSIENNIIFLLTILAVTNIVLVSYISRFFNSSIKTRVLKNIPVTRDVLLFTVFISSIFSLTLYGLYYLSIAPIFHILCSIILALKNRSGEIRPKKGRLPKPEVVVERKEIASRIENLISNSLKLITSFVFLSMITPVFEGIILITFEDLVLKSDHLLSALSLTVFIYFGYRILISLKFLIDIVTKRLVSIMKISEFTLRHMLTDALYIVIAVILWIYIPPQLRNIPYIGELISRIGALAIFAFFILIIYDMAKLLYKTFEEFYRRIVEKLTERLHGGGSSEHP
ncbi:MAG: NTP transferase domain-containing protein [Candidatus Brockarchaeota archaeon]|nr:NTP transferase domain-containing protein [Candidatus Brockarchaeota archaeon]